jgi:radical SAM-linked protein
MDLELTRQLNPQEVRRLLQSELPEDFALTSAGAVRVGGPSLSQVLRSARWSIELLPRMDPSAGPAAAIDGPVWQRAIDALLAAEQLPWHDRDKKGRPRRRDLRPYLSALRLTAPGRIHLEARIDAQGRSLRPEHLQALLAAGMGIRLALGQLRRDALDLKPAC